MDSEASKISKPKLIAAIIGVLVLISALVYWFSWRPSDDDYQAASALAAYTEKTDKVLTVELSAMQYPGHITVATPIKLQVLADAYKNAVDALGQNGAINRDLAVNSVYAKHRDTLLEHADSMVKLAKSTKLYTAILTACKQFTDSITNTKSNTYDSLLDECQSAISSGSTSAHKQFNDSFFTKYVDYTSKYITALDKLMNALNDDDYKDAKKSVDESYQALYKLGEVKLSFESPNVITITKELNTVLDAQKKALLR